MTNSTRIPISDAMRPVTIPNVNDGRRKRKPMRENATPNGGRADCRRSTASSEFARAERRRSRDRRSGWAQIAERSGSCLEWAHGSSPRALPLPLPRPAHREIAGWRRITVENAISDTDLRGVKAALASMSDSELDAVIDVTYKVPQSAPGLLAWLDS